MIDIMDAINKLEKYVDEELSTIAKERNISIYNNGKIDKGWKGFVLESILDIPKNKSRSPDGLNFELKSTPFYKLKRSGLWAPRETLAITMLHSNHVIDTPFIKSHCWTKLQSMLYCAVSWDGPNVPKSKLLKIQPVIFQYGDELVQQMEQDYELIREQLKNGSKLSSRHGILIQARTKGSKNTASRAFYGRKSLINKIIKVD